MTAITPAVCVTEFATDEVRVWPWGSFRLRVGRSGRVQVAPLKEGDFPAVEIKENWDQLRYQFQQLGIPVRLPERDTRAVGARRAG